MYLIYLSAYSPELNLIEILWRQMKYAWLPLSAYLSFDRLCEEVHRLLGGYRAQCAINFGSSQISVKRQGHLLSMPLGQVDSACQALFQQRSVGQVGQGIMLSQMRHAAGEGQGLTDVVKNDHSSGDLTVAVVDRGRRILDRQFAVIAPTQDRPHRQADNAVLFDGPPGRVAGRLARLVVYEMKDLGDGLPRALSWVQPVIASATR